MKVAMIAGKTIDAGLALPYWVLYAIMFTGISWSEEIFRTRKVHMALLDVFELLLSFDNSSMALRPAGVAAQPRPNILAMILVVMYRVAMWSFGMSGKRNLMSGERSLEAPDIIPVSSAIFISPVHILMTPSKVMHRETASLADSSAPFPTADMFPVRAP